MRKLKLKELNSGYEVSKKKSGGISKKGRAAIIVISALVIAFTATYIASAVGVLPLEAVFAKMFGGTKNFGLSLDSDSVVNIKNIGDGLLVLTDKSATLYGSDGKEIYTAVHSFSKPAVSVNGKKAAVFDRNGKGFILLNDKKQVLTGEADGVILAMCYGKNGSFAISSRGESSTSTLTVYNSRSDVIFKWNCAYENITSIALSDTGKSAGAALFGVKDGEYYTTVRYFDFDYSEPLSSATKSGAAPLVVAFTSRGGLTLFSDTGVYGLKKNSEEFECIDEFYTPEFNSFSVNSDGIYQVTLANHGSTNSFCIKLYDKNGAKKAEIPVTKELKSVSLGDKYIFALAENEIMVYNFKGAEVGKVSVTGKLYSIYPNDKYIYIYSLDKITKAYSYGDSSVTVG